MKTRRILIIGASGAGVTSLGRALADALALSHHDTDATLPCPVLRLDGTRQIQELVEEVCQALPA